MQVEPGQTMMYMAGEYEVRVDANGRIEGEHMARKDQEGNLVADDQTPPSPVYGRLIPIHPLPLDEEQDDEDEPSLSRVDESSTRPRLNFDEPDLMRIRTN